MLGFGFQKDNQWETIISRHYFSKHSQIGKYISDSIYY